MKRGREGRIHAKLCMSSGSKAGEVVVIDNGALSLSSVLVLVLTAFLLLLLSLGEEAESLQVLVKADTAGREFDNVLGIALADLLVLLGFEDGQLLLLDPFGVQLSHPHGSLLLEGVGNFNTLALVVLFQSGSFGLDGLLLDNRVGNSGGLSLNRGLLSLLLRLDGTFLDVFVLLELILEVADVAPSSSFLSGSVAEWIYKYGLPVPLCLSR
jgi:hypothetical protein